MKASEVIEELKKQIEIKGDIQVVFYDEYGAAVVNNMRYVSEIDFTGQGRGVSEGILLNSY